MNAAPPICRPIKVFGFRGTNATAAAYLRAVRDEQQGTGLGPTRLDSLLFAGHTGLSIDSGLTIYGFNPNSGGLAMTQLMGQLQSGNAFPGEVRDDTAVFTAAQNSGLILVSFEVVLPDPVFQGFKSDLDAERKRSHYTYGFPNGDGDCNCVTWLERVGLPLLTGRMQEFVALHGIVSQPRRRFGRCI